MWYFVNEFFILLLFPQNVSLQDYIKFGEFLNNLDEFSISLKIYNVANQPITQGTQVNIYIFNVLNYTRALAKVKFSEKIGVIQNRTLKWPTGL